MADPIVFRGPAARAGDSDKTAAALAQFREVASRVLREHGGAAVLDGLMSLWLDLSLSATGQAGTDESLRLLRRDLPRFAAALRAARAPEGGSA